MPRETIVVDASAYRWLGRVLNEMDMLSASNKPIGKLPWQASNAYDALTDGMADKVQLSSSKMH